MAEHAKLSASGSERWMACTASVAACEGLPNEGNEYSIDGTIAHDWASKVLERQVSIDDVPDQYRAAITDYIEVVAASIPVADDYVMWVEHKFALADIDTNMFGTADCVVYLPTSKKLIVIDFKFGAGVNVEAEGNTQLMYYALGALPLADGAVDTVQLKISQPRYWDDSKTYKEHTITFAELMDYKKRLVSAVTDVHYDPTYKAGEHCKYCPNKYTCTHLLMVVEDIFRRLKEMDELSPEAQLERLVALYEEIPTIKMYISKLEAKMIDAIKQEKIDGYGLKKSYGNRAWKDADKAIETIGALIGQKEMYEEPSLLSPSKVEAKMKLSKVYKDNKDVMESLTERPRTGYKIVKGAINEAVRIPIEQVFDGE